MIIEWFMFGALGFFLGCLLGLILAPPLWNRAVKLTTRRLEATMPMTLAEIQADKDQIRADFAIQLRKVEVALEKSKEKAARELIEANKRRVEIQKLSGDLEAANGELQEAENANRVLQQTIKRRLPDLDARLKAAKKALSDLEAVNVELRATIASQSEALKVARATVHNQRADIDQLRLSLESGSAAGRGSAKNDSRAVAESQRLAAELSRAQEELERVRTSSEEFAFLRRELNHLASQILDAARKQAPSMHGAMAAQGAGQATAHAAAHAGNGAETAATAFSDPAYADAHHEGTFAEEQAAETEETYPAEPSDYAVESDQDEAAYAVQAEYDEEQPDPTVQDDTAEHGYAAETYNGEDGYEIEEDFETYEIQGHYAAQEETAQEGTDQEYTDQEHTAHAGEGDTDSGDGEAHHEETQAPEDEAHSLSRRFAARRAKRQAEKSGGGSLSSRLRGLVADGPERRG